MMLLVGSALVVHYNKNPFTPREGIVVMDIKDKDFASASKKAEVALAKAPRLESPAATEARKDYIKKNPTDKEAKNFTHEGVSNVAVATKRDNIFPMWIVTQLPIGLSGLILAGVFAAAISSLDSILAALSQTTLSLLYHPETKTDEELEKLDLVSKSRKLVVAWGVILTLFTLLLMKANEGVNVLSLAFGMTAYTMGPMLGLFLASMLGKASVRGLVVGVTTSLLFVMFIRTDIWNLIGTNSEFLANFLDAVPTLDVKEVIGDDGSTSYKYGSLYYFGWAWPITTILTLACGLLIPGKNKELEHEQTS
eukprot:Seg18369.1 transcript_id=Seg18369.1/GoldUCD/mRNA.D3Y31 product="N-acetylneuraminate transporter" protein_id=Seg18369.1/GoldUCD/D3Y31